MSLPILLQSPPYSELRPEGSPESRPEIIRSLSPANIRFCHTEMPLLLEISRINLSTHTLIHLLIYLSTQKANS